MSKQANPKAIGSFVVGAIVLLIAGVLTFGTGEFMTDRPNLILFFEGSMGGLSVGSPVNFRGVKVGSVTDVSVHYNPKDRSTLLPVLIKMEGKVKIKGDVELDHEKTFKELIKQGLRAQLQTQSMVTGQKKIELDFYPDTVARLVDVEKIYIEIPTIPSRVAKLAKKIEDLPIEELFNKLLLAVEGIENVVNSPEVKGSIQSLDGTLKELEKLVKNVDGQVGSLTSEIEKTVKDARKLVNNLDEQAGSLMSNIDETVKDTRKIVRNADGQIAQILSGVDKTVKDTLKLVKNVDTRVESVTAGIEKTAEEARSAFEQGKKTLSSTEDVISKDSPLIYRLTETLEELKAAANSLRSMTDYLERHPDALLRGKGGPGGK